MYEHCGQFPPDLSVHIFQEHRDIICKICVTVDVRMMKHIVEHHSLPGCKGCKDYKSGDDIDGFVRHIQSHPSCLLCPNKTCPTGGLWRYLSEEHAILRCPACPKTESELSKAAEHMKEHVWRLCPECEEEEGEEEERPFTHAALELHLVLEHGWTLCPYCASAMVDEEHLKEHLAEHQLRDCSLCGQEQPSDQMKQHMTRDHGWRLCSFCDEPIQEASIFEHIRESHEQCSKCEFRGNLASHLEHSHAGAKYTICQKMFPGADLKDHMGTEHPSLRCPFPSYA